MATQLAYEFGDIVRYTPGSIKQSDILYRILFAAYNAGILTVLDPLTNP